MQPLLISYCFVNNRILYDTLSGRPCFKYPGLTKAGFGRAEKTVQNAFYTKMPRSVENKGPKDYFI